MYSVGPPFLMLIMATFTDLNKHLGPEAVTACEGRSSAPLRGSELSPLSLWNKTRNGHFVFSQLLTHAYVQGTLSISLSGWIY